MVGDEERRETERPAGHPPAVRQHAREGRAKRVRSLGVLEDRKGSLEEM